MSNINVANIVNSTTGDTTPTDNLSKQVAKAWVNFNGVGTVAIRDSYNVSSVTDIGVGDYRVNLIEPMPDTNYAAFASGVAVNTSPTVLVDVNTCVNARVRDTTTIAVAGVKISATAVDFIDGAHISVTVFSN